MKYRPQKPPSYDDGTLDYDFSFVFGLDLKNCPNENWTFKSHEVNENGVVVDTYSLSIEVSTKDGVLFSECEAFVRTGTSNSTSFRFRSEKNIIRDFFKIIEKHYIDNVRIDDNYTEIKYFKEIHSNYISFGDIDLVNGAKASYSFISSDYVATIHVPYVNPYLEHNFGGTNSFFIIPDRKPISKIIIFDTETTGLSPHNNDIIQLSYQVINFSNWRVIKKVNNYFHLPDDNTRIDWKAIQADRLIKEKTGRIEFSDLSFALKNFFLDLSSCQLVVSHNFAFDKSFIEAAKKRLKIRGKINWPFVADTMEDTTEFCSLYPMHFERHKFPRLLELAKLLNVPFYEDKFHDSQYDVEITKKCFRSLYDLGFYLFRYDERSKNRKSVMYCSNILIYY